MCLLVPKGTGLGRQMHALYKEKEKKNQNSKDDFDLFGDLYAFPVSWLKSAGG